MGGACMPSGGVIIFDSSKHIDSVYPEYPNARFDIFNQFGKLIKQYWTDYLGNLIYRRDHTNHNNPKQHPEVPHDHDVGANGPNAPWISVDRTGRFC